MASRSSGATTAPDGFDGVFRMIALVFGVIAASIIFAVMRKFSSSLLSTRTALPPAYWMMSLNDTQ